MNSTSRPRRSVLYMPGSNVRALEKAKSLPADAVILDLEDAVSPDAKETARAQIVEAVTAGGYGYREIIVRVNGFDTPWGAEDLAAVAPLPLDAVLVPKVSTAADVRDAADRLKSAGAGKDVDLWIMMETPLAVLNAGSIAATAAEENNPLACMVMGTNDLAKETRASLTRGRAPMLGWLQTCLASARAYGLTILDGVFNDLADEEAFTEECRQGVDLGMDGKTLIHPRQIDPCNRAFSPTDEETDWAKKVIAAFELPENADKGVVQVDGRMVERLHADMARQVLQVATAIANRD